MAALTLEATCAMLTVIQAHCGKKRGGGEKEKLVNIEFDPCHGLFWQSCAMKTACNESWFMLYLGTNGRIVGWLQKCEATL